MDDVDLTIEAGTFTGLLGPNGAGKSTLIECTFGARTDAAPPILLTLLPQGLVAMGRTCWPAATCAGVWP